ncbi:TMEM165/GDT1 family protein [Vibrio ulleungensis]|uniref:GDT1 family protein n=1 Tax=Vibrio ulleungensis TaxID=2807619 RepID=A0ABS2HJL9_9VIBR|nr:TMEM165/GDT1 family protein [Vibrio ulleungensis]MBM7036861.1 TMEM165/GDT1 family protein [Vibrio ulleungensis]
MHESSLLFSSAMLTFWAIFLAEMGDKSQLVCMALAAKHRSKPILIAAVCAFSILNLVAVALGVSLGNWFSEFWITIVAAAAFAYFGLTSFFGAEEDDDEEISQVSSRRLFINTFLLLFVAELGDKTQLAVVTLSTTHNMYGVWIGATIALIGTSALGIYAGRRWLSKIDMGLLHKISGAFFIGLAITMLITLVRL